MVLPMSDIVAIHVRFPGDWEALYVDGDRVAQDHSVDVGDVLEEVKGHTVVESRSEWKNVSLSGDFGGHAPKEYNSLPEE